MTKRTVSKMTEKTGLANKAKMKGSKTTKRKDSPMNSKGLSPRHLEMAMWFATIQSQRGAELDKIMECFEHNANKACIIPAFTLLKIVVPEISFLTRIQMKILQPTSNESSVAGELELVRSALYPNDQKKQDLWDEIAKLQGSQDLATPRSHDSQAKEGSALIPLPGNGEGK